MFTKRSFFTIVGLLIIASLVLGGWLGGTLQAVRDTTIENLSLFTQVFSEVQKKYVEPVDPQKLIIGAVKGMLATLDPHTQYLDKDEYRDLMVGTHGSFGGLGIQIDVRDGVLTVISPMEGTPAHKSGILSGDQILKIDGKSTKGMSSQDAVKVLRGPKGTQVTLTINREGTSELLDFTITRDIINIQSVPYFGLIKNGIGYIRLLQFSEKSGDEVKSAIDSMEVLGMKSLILDLRGNPGGLLTQAVSVSEKFLDKGQRIVFTKGRLAESNREYFTEKSSEFGKFPLVILVDNGSASASEIVSGAVQDWDRGLIVGKTTFGKGSVQSVVQLSGETGLRLTTAKYYTPSGRCIHKGEVEEDTTESSLKVMKKEVFHTLGNLRRTVYGGGGITPDIVIEYPKSSKFEQSLNPHFFGFAVKYCAIHRNLPKELKISDDIMAAFKQYLTDKKVSFTDNDIKQSDSYIRLGIKNWILYNLYGEKTTYSSGVRFENDTQFQKAIELLSKSKNLNELLAFGIKEEGKK